MSSSLGSATLDKSLTSLGTQFFKIWHRGDGDLSCPGLLEAPMIAAAAHCVLALTLRHPPRALCELSHFTLAKSHLRKAFWGDSALKSAL